MRSTFHSLETAKRSLFTQTAALGTTGHNIANANTEGYSRQVVKMQASIPMEAYGLSRSTIAGQMGTGVEFTSIDRIREMFLDDQFRGENSSFGSWNIQYDTLDKLEAIINEPSDSGIRKVMDKFWNSWSELSKSPDDPTARKIVKQTAEALTDALNHMSTQLDNLSKDLNSNIDVKAREAQGYLTTIADLNKTINRIEQMGDQANDLRDQRDLMADKLSKIMDITVTDGEGGYNVSLGGQNLVEGEAVTVTVDGAFLTTAFASGDLKGGEVHGMIISKDTLVEDYRNQINSLANTLVNGDVEVTLPAGAMPPEGTILTSDAEVKINGQVSTLPAGQPMPKGAVLNKDVSTTVKGFNGLHQLGYTMDGSTDKGVPFFTAVDGGSTITAGNIRLNQVISDNPDKIATSMRLSSDGNSVINGNNDLAKLLTNLKDSPFTILGGTSSSTIDGLFRSMVGQLGVQTQESYRQTENSYTLVSQVETRRMSVSGVSLDEEMTNMIKFQHAYSAASRFLTTFDQLLDKLINSTGVVGR
ncbi:flagellar hook-associated protein 1 FlgK [Paenibacillus uliginis N3/975]|uniref:Flagellar hook-associated protein 1 n=1 Tax=Paenibacillus uliginis N3/975 TaxID=1313296 RepID=A0A1X7GBR4_9BACL|nr:flagellar hook-associated protein FlgK [Paenibacillus uliginis]SMF67189.1 flagellar hook-associated protein 1 FlgK [Paenibacillus uliginis N3/975]